MLDKEDRKKLYDKLKKKHRKKIGKPGFDLSVLWELEISKKRRKMSFRQRNIELKEIYRLRDKIEKEMRAAANAAQENTPAGSQASDDGNQVPIANILDSTVAPTDITEAYIEDTDIQREPECNESYQPSYDHDPFEFEPEQAAMEPILPIHLISYEHGQQQEEWQEREKQLNEELKRRNAEKDEARKQKAEEHLKWWEEVEPIVLQSYQKQISETGKPHYGRFDFDDYCGCNCVPRCEIQLICLVGSFS